MISPCNPGLSKRLLRSTLLLCVTLVSCAIQADEKVEEVLVTGEHPGPGMWKVTNGDKTLWILGTYEPLPVYFLWRSQQVEFAMSEAQQVIGNYSATFTFPNGNPLGVKGKPLKKLLTRKDYAKWKALKKELLGNRNDFDDALPVTAALVLRSAAFERAGLTSSNAVWMEIGRLANNYHIPITTDHQVNRVVNGFVPDDVNTQRAGVAYLVATMNNLDGDLRNARLRANAWATGNIDALREQAAADVSTANLYANSWPYFKAGELQELTATTNARWIEAAAGALQRNHATLATLPIFLLLKPDGLLQTLRSRGFEVEEPGE
jgi:TraB/PrgY/gumN family